MSRPNRWKRRKRNEDVLEEKMREPREDKIKRRK